MGYSIATPIKSQKAKAKMKDFMEKNYRPTSILFGLDYDHGRFGDDLSYDDGKCRLGFDYSSGVHDTERTYIFLICR
jgi:hypothetical protein